MTRILTDTDRAKVMDLLRRRSVTYGYADFTDCLDVIGEENILSQRAADLDEYLTEQVKIGTIAILPRIGIDESRRFQIRN